MSTAEDVELRDLVAQTLEKNGCLAKLRAELRASIFLALEDDMKLSKQQPLQNLRIQSYLETPEGRAMFCLVREFLEFFNLQFTISVYEPESYLDSIYHYEGRQKTAKDLGLENIEEPTVPLLQQLLKIAQARNNVLDINLNLGNNINSSFKNGSLNMDSYKKTESECISSNATSNDILHENNECLNTTFDVNTLISNFNNSNNTSQDTEVTAGGGPKFTDNTIKDKSSATAKSTTSSVFKKRSNVKVDLVNELKDTEKDLKEKQIQFDKTFEVNSPILNHIDARQLYIENDKNQTNLKIVHEDDTYEDTSSIAEDMEFPTVSSPKLYDITVNSVPPIDVSTNDSTISSNKSKLESDRTKNLRPKTILNSLSDLPSLPINNKPKLNNQILPSLYNKDFKDKSNSKELDKMFDMEAEYEEDFMSNSNDISLSNSALQSIQQKNSSNYTSKSELSPASDNAHSSNVSSKTKFKKSHSENGSLLEHSLSD